MNRAARPGSVLLLVSMVNPVSDCFDSRTGIRFSLVANEKFHDIPRSVPTVHDRNDDCQIILKPCTGILSSERPEYLSPLNIRTEHLYPAFDENCI